MVRQDIAVLGSDRSSGLAQVAATRLAAGTGAASGTPHLLASYPLLFHLSDITVAAEIVIAVNMQPTRDHYWPLQ